MSIIDKASFVLIPSGYSEGSVYPVKNPINPSKFSYTRSATSTRVNSKGLIENVPYNLLSGSNSALGVTQSGGSPGTTLTTNAGLAPDGTYTATFVDYTTAIEASKNVEFNLYNVDSKTFTASVWVKGTAGQTINLVLDWNGFSGANVQKTLDGTWQRFSITKTYSENYGTYSCFRIGIRALYGYSGTATQVYLWGVQIVEGTEAKDYLVTTDRLNVPTLDYSTGKPTFLFEPSVTNLVLGSEDFSNANWIKQGTPTVNSNTTIAPDGNQTADTLNITPNNWMYRGVALTGGTTYTFSVYVKVASGTNQFKLGAYGQVNGSFSSGTFVATTTWQRFSFTFTPTVNETIGVYPVVVDGFTGGAFQIWGAQVQTGATASSYIPTTNASVTRVGGSTGTFGSSYFGTNKGTVLLGIEGIKTHVTSGSSATIRLQSGGNLVMTLYDDSSGLGFYDYYGTSFLCNVDRNNKKMLIKWDGTTSVGFVNGVKTVTLPQQGSTRSIDNMQGLAANLNSYNVTVFAIFPEALSDAECISLTS